MDLIHVKDIIISGPGYINLNPGRSVGTVPVIINLTIYTDFSETGNLDDLSKSIDYVRVTNSIRSLAEDHTKVWKSFEGLAQQISRMVIFQFGAKKVCVTVQQTRAFFNVSSLSIQTTRTAADFLKHNTETLVQLPDDVLKIGKLEVSTIIGVEPDERENIQALVTNIEIYPCIQRNLPSSKQFQKVVRKFSEHIKLSAYGTVEAFVNSLAVLGLDEFQFRRIKIRVDKPYAMSWTDGAAVEVDHDQNWLQESKIRAVAVSYNNSLGTGDVFAFLGIGTNLGSRIKNIDIALDKLKKSGDCRVLDTSFLYETKPMYVTDQPKFLNGVIKIQTALSPQALLLTLKVIEAELGRTGGGYRNSPRVIDLDILFYDNWVLESDDLTIPHIGIAEREFVLRPLCDIALDMKHPKLGQTCGQLLAKIEFSKQDSSSAVAKVMPMYRSCETKWKWNGRTLVMGVLNLSMDSFSGDGYPNLEDAIARAEEIVHDGADVIDIGGMSQSPSPGTEAVSAADEIRRIVPVIHSLRARGFQQPISVDTVRAEVAEAVVEAGADIINDVSGGRRDLRMLSAIARLGVPFIIAHMRKEPCLNLSKNDNIAKKDVISEVRVDLASVVEAAISAGIYRWNLILDAGLGTPKSIPECYTVLRDHQLITRKGWPLSGFPTLLGPSRKNFIGLVTEVPEPEKRVFGNAGAVAACVAGGANIVRVHDVKEMVQVVKVADCVWKCESMKEKFDSIL